MNPKAANLPMINVNTGAANPKNALAETLLLLLLVLLDGDDGTRESLSCAGAAGFLAAKLNNPKLWFSTNFFLAAGIKAAVPAHCANVVAIAAPCKPNGNTRTNKKSPMILVTVLYKIAIKGVTESFAPKRDACNTPNNSDVGKDIARINTYSVADFNKPGVLVQVSCPMYNCNNGRVNSNINIINPIPQFTATCADVRTTDSARS